MRVGTIVFVAPNGWGFIKQAFDDFGSPLPTTEKDIYFHKSGTVINILDMRAGQVVEYAVSQHNNKPCAVEVRPRPTSATNGGM